MKSNVYVANESESEVERVSEESFERDRLDLLNKK